MLVVSPKLTQAWPKPWGEGAHETMIGKTWFPIVKQYASIQTKVPLKLSSIWTLYQWRNGKVVLCTP